MRRIIACNAVATLLLATVYAPLFHLHTNSIGQAPLIHAHFPDLDTADTDGKEHVESADSHGEARSIDILTATATHLVRFDAIILTAYVSLNPERTCCGFVRVAVPRAHAPPGLQFPIPRSPPA